MKQGKAYHLKRMQNTKKQYVMDNIKEIREKIKSIDKEINDLNNILVKAIIAYLNTQEDRSIRLTKTELVTMSLTTTNRVYNVTGVTCLEDTLVIYHGNLPKSFGKSVGCEGHANTLDGLNNPTDTLRDLAAVIYNRLGEDDSVKRDNVNGKKTWDVEVDKGTTPIPSDTGYFGKYTIITIGGKQNVVFVDMRDAICVLQFEEWYDRVISTSCSVTTPWDADTRFCSHANDNPCVIVKDGKYNLIGVMGKSVSRNLSRPLCSVWYDYINPKRMHSDGHVIKGYHGYYFSATLNEEQVFIDDKGNVIDKDCDAILSVVRKYSKGEIRDKWIMCGRQCAVIHGFEYRGASPHVGLLTDVALDYLSKSSFGKGFNSMSWRVIDGKVTLLFEVYSECDML